MIKLSMPRFEGSQHTARSVALQVLIEALHKNAFARDLLHTHLENISLPSRDRRLATHLVYGVIRRRSTLDGLLKTAVTRPQHKVEPWLWEILRLGTFQLALLTQIPVHAAIYETVVMAEVFGRHRAKPFINAVLRQVSRLILPHRIPGPAPDALPIEAGEYRRLTLPVLPDPVQHPLEYLAMAFALPLWLVRRWHKRFSLEECIRLGFWFAGPAPLWLRSNLLRVDRAGCLKAFNEAGIKAEPGDHPQAIRLSDFLAIEQLPGYDEGLFTVQDESAMRVASALAPRPGTRVLDLCAAPGGKTTHLAEMMANYGQIVACDVDDRRLQVLRSLCIRLGITIVNTVGLNEAQGESPPEGPYDSALVDVPCSNTGVLGRRPEVRWRLQPEDFHRFGLLQTKLLRQAAEQVRPGGTIVYSTCSIEEEENANIVRQVMRSLPDLTLESHEQWLPGKPADGGYWARLRRQPI